MQKKTPQKIQCTYERERERERERETDRQTDRQADRQTERKQTNQHVLISLIRKLRLLYTILPE